MGQITKMSCIQLDEQDGLSALREEFVLPPEVIYLDGNSLGVLPKKTSLQMKTAIEKEWGQGLIRSWNQADWIHMPQRLGDKLAPLIGANEGEVIITDSTSINIFKVLVAALRLNATKNVIVTESANFPTDLYISESVITMMGCERRLIPEGESNIEKFIDDSVAVVLLTHINFKTGEIYDMERITQKAHMLGALVVWDLCHSVGAVPLHLSQHGVDFAVGCTYKFLNGGPGAPAFVYVKKSLLPSLQQPLTGWMGHAKPFNFDIDYQSAKDISQFLCGTPPILSYTAIDTSLDVFAKVDMHVVRDKSIKLTQLFIDLMEQECADYQFQLITPKDANSRGSMVSFTHPEGYPIIQALIANGVIGDFRAPNILRFGIAPLYLRYVDIWNTVQYLKKIMETSEWNHPKFKTREAVT